MELEPTDDDLLECLVASMKRIERGLSDISHALDELADKVVAPALAAKAKRQ